MAGRRLRTGADLDAVTMPPYAVGLLGVADALGAGAVDVYTMPPIQRDFSPEVISYVVDNANINANRRAQITTLVLGGDLTVAGSVPAGGAIVQKKAA